MIFIDMKCYSSKDLITKSKRTAAILKKNFYPQVMNTFVKYSAKIFGEVLEKFWRVHSQDDLSPEKCFYAYEPISTPLLLVRVLGDGGGPSLPILVGI